MTHPTPPIEYSVPFPEVASRFDGKSVDVPDAFVGDLAGLCAVTTTDPAVLAEAGRDWWPLTLHWALAGMAPALPCCVVRPRSTSEVAAVLAACNDEGVPVTPIAGRSGVCGASVPAFGGVALDLTGMAGVEDIDTESLAAAVFPGTFGPDLEIELREHGMTLGHWPQSMAISTVGGWLACRGAGQYSTRYGKIEDMVLGLEVVLANGRVLRTGGATPRAAMGPGLTGLFVGSEGTLGIITQAVMQLHPVPPVERRVAFGFPSFIGGLQACRSILQRGATPAVLRLYDVVETKRNFDVDATNVLIVLDEGDGVVVDAAMRVVEQECVEAGAELLDVGLVATWMEHRNDTSALQALIRMGIVVDTIEIAAPWRSLPGIYQSAISALSSIPGNLNASAHQSHAYTSGACLYFTFAGNAPEGTADAEGWKGAFYDESWRAVMGAVMAGGGAISHHHGIGINRARFMEPALGGSYMATLGEIKHALDPRGILNPGKLSLPSPFGPVPWP